MGPNDSGFPHARRRLVLLRRRDDVNTINTWAEPHNANGVTPNSVIDSNDEPAGNNQQRMAARGYRNRACTDWVGAGGDPVYTQSDPSGNVFCMFEQQATTGKARSDKDGEWADFTGTTTITYDPFGDTFDANMWADTYTTTSTNPIQNMTGFRNRAGEPGYVAYGAGDFDGQNSGHDFYGTLWMPPTGFVNNCDGGRSHSYCDYHQQRRSGSPV
jgi:hypothetical protein